MASRPVNGWRLFFTWLLTVLSSSESNCNSFILFSLCWILIEWQYWNVLHFLIGSPATRWASVAFGAGAGLGSAYSDCSRLFDSPTANLRPPQVSSSPVSQVKLISFCLCTIILIAYIGCLEFWVVYSMRCCTLQSTSFTFVSLSN